MTDAGDPPAGSDGADDALDAIAERLLQDLDSEEASQSVAGGLEWIRSTLRRGGNEGDPLVGELFQGKYRILRRVGRGGFGAVYEAVDERGAHNRVALKIQLPGFARSPERLESFRAEAIRVTRLSHPNIVDWKSFDETPDGGSYFVMELVDGLPLSDVVERDAPLEWRRATALLLQILAALRAAHFVGEGQSILHLDLKPKNILVLPPRRGREETAKVIDFGIGQYLGAETEAVAAEGEVVPPPVPATLPDERSKRRSEEHGTLTTAVTDSTDFARRAARFPFQISQAYTAEYASPEHCVHIEFANGQDITPEALDGRADLYSVGVIAYELLTGRLPYTKPVHRAQWIQRHREAPVEPWGAEAEARVPRTLRRFVLRCLEKSPAARFGDADEAFEALERIARPSRRKRFAAAGAALVLVGVLIASLFTPEGGRLDLKDSDGLPIGTLHFGAGGEPWSARLEVASTGAALEAGVPLQLVSEGSEALADWTVLRTSERELTLSPDEDFAALRPGREAFPRTRLESLDGTWSSDPFDLVWLGDGALAGEARIGGARLVQAEPLRIDPEGLPFHLRLSELRAVDFVTGASKLRCAGRRVPLEATDDPAGGCTLRASLPSGGAMEDGLSDGAFELALRTSQRFEVPFRVEFASSALRVDPFALDAQQRRTAWNTGSVWRGEPVELLLTANRPARARSTALALDDLVFVPSAARAFEARHSLAEWLGEESAAPWNFDLTIVDDVLHAPPAAARHRVQLELPVRVIERRSFDVDLSSAIPGLRTEDLGPAPRPRFAAEIATNGSTPLTLTGLGAADLERFEFELLLEDGRTRRLELPRSGEALDLQPQLAALGALVDGRCTLSIRSWRLDARGSREGGAPNSERSIALVVDRMPPRLTVPQAPLLVTPDAPIPRLELPYPSDEGAEVRRRWRLVEPGTAEGSEWRTQRATPGETVRDAGPFLVIPLDAAPPGGGAWPDGLYHLEIQPVDAAGNSALVQRVSLEIAKRGPRLVPLTPAEEVGSEIAAWAAPGGELQSIALEAIDANGVDEVTCNVFRANGGSAGLPAFEVRAVPLQSPSGEVRGQWTWRFEPEDSFWSEADDVLLRFRARDGRGRVSAQLHGPFRLPRVRERYPERLESLLLVPGNHDAEYVYRGRSSVVDENRAFRDAGLRALWVGPGRERPGETQSAWAVAVPRGELETYYLGEREVSAAELLAFVRDPAGYVEPAHWRGGDVPSEARRAALSAHLERLPADRPATEVWHAEAEAYARSLGRRLPTLLEIEYAVRGAALYRARSWDVDGSNSHDPDSPWHRLRGLSSGAEWTASPAVLDAAGGALHVDAPELAPDEPAADAYWIAGALAGHVLQSRSELRHDFAAVDVGDARGWSNPRVGFRLASGARRALEAARALDAEAEE